MGLLAGSCWTNGGLIWVYWRGHVGLMESYGSTGGLMWV
jgi:hypothetical protein